MITDPDGKLNQSAIQIKRIPGFSLNKIPNSVPIDLNIRIKNEFNSIYNNEWKEGTDGLMPQIDHFEIDTSRKHYFLIISDLEGYSDAYTSTDNNKPSCYFQLNVSHKPLMSNYWHFEFKVIADGTEIKDIGKTKAGYKRLICGTIRDRVQEKAVFDIIIR